MLLHSPLNRQDSIQNSSKAKHSHFLFPARLKSSYSVTCKRSNFEVLSIKPTILSSEKLNWLILRQDINYKLTFNLVQIRQVDVFRGKASP